MKMVKSLILGSAAGLLAMGGAQAADLPVKAKAVEYVKICSLYGAGFYYIPGTDTCIKLGGYLRVDLALNGGDYNPYLNGTSAANNRLTNYFASRSRSDFTIDTRTATEYGVVRTFADMVFTWTTGTYAGSAPGAFDRADQQRWSDSTRPLQCVHPVRWIHAGSLRLGLRRTVAELSGWRP